jgi:hypothetical protein
LTVCLAPGAEASRVIENFTAGRKRELTRHLVRPRRAR